MNTNFRLHERIKRSIRALKDLVNRFQQSRTSQLPADSFAAIAEALDWITRLDSDLNKLCKTAYEAKRDKMQSGKGVLGHRLARNLLQHNLKTVDLVDVTRGVQFPVRPPVCPYELRWKVRTTLPDPATHDSKLVSSYDQFVAERLVRETLFEVFGFFGEVVNNI